jgi:hypothetical protein
MLTRKFLLLVLAVVASGTLSVATQVSAQPAVCTAGVYTVTAQTPIDVGEERIWKFNVNSTSSSLKELVFVIPRPVTREDIIPLAPRTYCEQADSNTKLNRGNCDGFPLSVPLIKDGNKLVATIRTSPRVTEGLITANLISGSATADTCIAFENNVPTGIVGPGEVGDPFQPVSITQTVLAAGGKCEVELLYDTAGNLEDIRLLSGPPCEKFTGDVLVAGKKLQNNTNPHGITFGDGTTTCYGPPVPSPARCICTKAPCP